MTASWEQTRSPKILSGYELRDIYKYLWVYFILSKASNKTFRLKGERSTEKKIKVCLKGLAAGNGVGEKLPMLVIGKAEKPFQYRPQRKSYMESEIFSDYVRKHDIKFHAEGRKVALIIDNSLPNPNVDNLKAIELVFSHTAHPPNNNQLSRKSSGYWKLSVARMLWDARLNTSMLVKIYQRPWSHAHVGLAMRRCIFKHCKELF